MLSAEELLRLRDKTIPDFLRESNEDGLLEVEFTLWNQVVYSPVQPNQKALRDDIVYIAIWVRFLRLQVMLPTTSIPQDSGETLLEEGLFDVTSTDAIMYNCITAGTQTNPNWLKICVGHTLAVYASQALNAYEVKVELTRHPESVVVQLYAVLYNLSQSCSFERRGDTYLHQILKSKLSPSRKCSLAWLETPLRELPEQYGNDTNKLVRPYIETTASQALDTCHIETATSIDVFILVISILQETIDGVMIHCLINDDIIRHEQLEGSAKTIPQPCIITNDFQSDRLLGVMVGYVWKKQIYTCRTGSYRLLHICIHWIEKIIEVLGQSSEAAQSLSALLEVCINPDRVLSSNPFSKYL